ncbi:unnamed protein product [Linum tenue]|uniref:Membrane protein of ER body-like protein n=1 Tax=Linum tenue TaxID=586396 RepID=A0AAV0KX46_9ROSI|nr:unnamed protein product [Linum tenue]
MAAAVAEQQEWRVEEEEEEEPLIGRQNQNHKTPATYAEAAVIGASNGTNGHGSLQETLSSAVPVAEEQAQIAGGNFPIANYGLSEAKDTSGESGTVFISKTLLVEKNEGVTASSSSSSSSSSATSSVVENGSSSVIIGGTKNEVTEVILENVYQKHATQEFFCPNCQACIKKVILQGADNDARQPATPPPPPVHSTFRCTSCFSFLIPVGNWIFGSRGQDDDYEDITDQVDVHVPQGTPSAPPAATNAPSGEQVVVDQGKVPTAGPPTAAPVSEQGKAPQSGSKPEKQPATTEGAGQKEDGGHVSVTSRDPPTIGFPAGGWGDWRNKVPPPSQPEQEDSGKVNVIVDDGNASVNVTIDDKNKGGRKGILGIFFNKLPVIGAQQVGNMDNGIATGLLDAQGPETKLPVSTTDEAPAPVPWRPDVVVSVEPSTIPPPGRVASGRQWDILKSIVYGGLAELITSLSIVTAAASADTDTLKIMAIGIANLIGGLSLLATNISDLKCEQPRRFIVSPETQEEAEVDRYCDLLGQRSNFKRHAFFAVLSFLVFGLVPPVVYGFSFKESDNRDYKIAAAAAASIVCVVLLAFGKAHVQKPPKTHFKTVLFYLTVGFMVSGVSFAAGNLFKKVMDDLGWFEPVAEAPPAAAAAIAGMASGMPAWGSY